MKSGAKAPKHEKRDDVAVVVDQGTIVTRARPENLMDLTGPMSIEFTPAGDGFAVSRSEEGADVYGTILLEIAQPFDAVEIPLGFTFPFFGRTYDSAWINGAGNLTFGAQDPENSNYDLTALRTAARFASGPPRIAPFYSDLFPAWVAVETLGDRAVITWDAFGSGLGVQAILRADGSIRFSYPEVLLDAPSVGDSIVGVSPGESGVATHIVDFLSDLPASFGRGVIAEVFGVVSQKAFDLSLQSVTFAPVENGFAITRAPAVWNPDVGPALGIGPGGSAEVALPFSFSFAGRQYDRIVISDDGNIGFEERCTVARPAFLGGGPCIFAFGRNLQPSLGGSIHAAASGDHVLVTWSAVPSFGSAVTAQATLVADGRIVLSYPLPIVGNAARFVAVGVAAGAWAPPIQELDFTADLPATVAARTVIEEFTTTFEHFDFHDGSLTFSPEDEGFRIATGRGGLDGAHHRLTDRIPVGCDRGTPGCGSVAVELPFAFPFLGHTYERIFVNANGSITLGEPDPRELTTAVMLGGPPRITPASFPDSPGGSQFGRVSAYSDAAGTVITWDRVFVEAEMYFGELSFQALLAPDGTIQFVYVVPPIYGIVGVAEGSNEGPIHEIDLTAESGPFPAGIIFEEFGPFIPFNLVDIVELSTEFYANQPDKFDFLVVFTDFSVDLNRAYAFNVAVSNATLGLGRLDFLPETYDFSSFFGSGGELESLLMMNNINIFWPDARQMIDPPFRTTPFGRLRIMGIGDGGPLTPTTDPWILFPFGMDSPMSLLAHETGHRWLAHAPFTHPRSGVGGDSGDLFNQFHHWNFFFNTAVPSGQFQGDPRASVMEGHVFHDLGGPAFPAGIDVEACAGDQHAFLTDRLELWDGYGALDQYFMGLRPAFEVGPFFYVDNGTRPLVSRETAAVLKGAKPVCGTRVDLSVADIISHPEMGPRVPYQGDENDGGGVDVKTMAFVLLTLSDNHDEAVKRVDTFRKAFERYANGFATGMRGRFDTSLNPKIF